MATNLFKSASSFTPSKPKNLFEGASNLSKPVSKETAQHPLIDIGGTIKNIVSGNPIGALKSSGVLDTGINAIKNTASTLINAPKTIANEITQPDATKNFDSTPGHTAFPIESKVLGAVARTGEALLSPLTGTMKAVTDTINQTIQAHPALTNNPLAKGVIDIFNQHQAMVDEAVKKDPEIAKNIGNSFSAILSSLALMGLGKTGGDLQTINKVNEGVGSVKELGNKTVVKVSEMVKGKPEAKVLSTPAENVKNLSLKEQKVWYDNAAKNIETQTQNKISQLDTLNEIEKTNAEASHGITKQQISEDLRNKIAVTDKNAIDLQKELSQRADTNVENLRQPAKNLAKAKGEQFGQLRDEAIKGKEDVIVKKIQLSKIIDETINDPTVAGAVKNQLGIEGTGRGGRITLGEIYDRVKSLRENMGSYDPSDYVNNQTVKALNNIMKDNGVDFTEANKMWSEWAPVKEKIDSAFDIYNKSGLTKPSSAKVLISAAKEVDASNVKFIKTLEDMTGENFTKDIKATLEKMDVNKKTALADKFDAATKSMENEALKAENLKSSEIQQKLKRGEINQDQANKLKALESKKYEDGRSAWRKLILKSVIGGGITTEAIRRMITGHF